METYHQKVHTRFIKIELWCTVWKLRRENDIDWNVETMAYYHNYSSVLSKGLLFPPIGNGAEEPSQSRSSLPGYNVLTHWVVPRTSPDSSTCDISNTCFIPFRWDCITSGHVQLLVKRNPPSSKQLNPKDYTLFIKQGGKWLLDDWAASW